MMPRNAGPIDAPRCPSTAETRETDASPGAARPPPVNMFVTAHSIKARSHAVPASTKKRSCSRRRCHAPDLGRPLGRLTAPRRRTARCSWRQEAPALLADPSSRRHHTLTFKNPNLPPVTKRVTITANKTTKLSFQL
jgi:hypothetical protein